MEAEFSKDFPDRIPDVINAWPEYFPDVDIKADECRVALIKQLIPFFRSPNGRSILDQVSLDGSIYNLPLDMDSMKRNCSLRQFWTALDEAPGEAISCIGAAAYEELFCSGKQLAHPGRINIRLYNYPESILALKNLKAAAIGRLISVRGTVVRMSVVKPMVTQMDFTCTKCANTTRRRFFEGKFSPPTSCETGGCRSKNFTPERKSAKTMDFQKIRVQEILSASGHEEGRMPRTVECELTADLVDSCVPADVVTVCGIVKVINTDIDAGGGMMRLHLPFLSHKDLNLTSERFLLISAMTSHERGFQVHDRGRKDSKPLLHWTNHMFWEVSSS